MERLLLKGLFRSIFVLLLLCGCSPEKLQGLFVSSSTTISDIDSLSFSFSIDGSNPGFSSSPDLNISIPEFQSSFSISLYSDSNCSQLLGTKSISSSTSSLKLSGFTVDLETPIYYQSLLNGSIGACMEAGVSYRLASCPSGYIKVPRDVQVGVSSDFCVMEYEARQSAGAFPEVDGTVAPWVNISQTDSKFECQSLNGINGTIDKYDLISNPEWMALSRNIEQVDANWTGGLVGSGCLKRGNVGGANACTGGDSGYDGPNPDFGAVRADNGTISLVLDNGETVYDLSGNLAEWVDVSLGGTLVTDIAQGETPYVSGDGNTVDAFRELSAVDTFTTLVPQLLVQPVNTSFGSAEGMGEYYSSTAGGALMRGGHWFDQSTSGIYYMSFDFDSTVTAPALGFRCVYRP